MTESSVKLSIEFGLNPVPVPSLYYGSERVFENFSMRMVSKIFDSSNVKEYFL